jgi:lysophospholipase L1-like esterase
MTRRWQRKYWIAAMSAVIAVGFAATRAVEFYKPGWRIAAQIMAAKAVAAFGQDIILLVGDSRIAGLGRRSIDRPHTRVFNLGLSGSRASEWRDVLMQSDLPQHAAVVMWIGVNDIWKDNTQPATVAHDLRAAIAALAARGHAVVLLGQIPADARVGPAYERITLGCLAIDALIDAEPPAARRVPVADLFKIPVDSGSTPLLHDGIHLTADGNRQVWQRIANAIETQRTDRRP